METKETKQYDRISCYLRQKLEEKVYAKIKEEFLIKDSKFEKDGYQVYQVQLQNLDFYCAYSNDELQHIISTCTDLLETMKQRVNAGETKESLAQVKQQIEERDKNCSPEKKAFFDGNGYAREISSDECETLIYLLGVYTRVGGTYGMFFSYPRMRMADAAVFEACIDRFDDMDIYYTALYFLTRAAMGMHEIHLEDPESEQETYTAEPGGKTA